MTNTRAQRKLLHTCIILVIVEQHLVQIGRIDRPTTQYLLVALVLVCKDAQPPALLMHLAAAAYVHGAKVRSHPKPLLLYYSRA